MERIIWLRIRTKLPGICKLNWNECDGKIYGLVRVIQAWKFKTLANENFKDAIVNTLLYV